MRGDAVLVLTRRINFTTGLSRLEASVAFPGLQLLVFEEGHGRRKRLTGGVHPIIESESHPTITDRLPLEYTRLDLAHGIANVGARCAMMPVRRLSVSRRDICDSTAPVQMARLTICWNCREMGRNYTDFRYQSIEEIAPC
jgi:hypothetical protein